MLRKFMPGIAAYAAIILTIGACANLPAPYDDIATPAPPTSGYEVCADNGGPGVVQIKYENTVGCDIVPPQTLTLIVDETTYQTLTDESEGWGGDASLAWAEQLLDDSGCLITWYGGDWAVGTECDY